MYESLLRKDEGLKLHQYVPNINIIRTSLLMYDLRERREAVATVNGCTSYSMS